MADSIHQWPVRIVEHDGQFHVVRVSRFREHDAAIPDMTFATEPEAERAARKLIDAQTIQEERLD